MLWRAVNPGGGGAFAEVAGGPDGLLLAASDLSGAYRSLDGGSTWHIIGARHGLTVTHVSGLGFDPQDPRILYLGTEEGIFRSENRGATFAAVLDHGYVKDVAFAASNPRIGYAAYHSRFDMADGRLYRSEDRGRSWHPVAGAGLPADLRVLKVLVHPRDENRVFLLSGEDRFACGPAALFTSEDGGRTWYRLAPDLGQVLDVALDPHAPDALYLSTYGDLWDPGYQCLHDDPRGGRVYRGAFAHDGPWEALPLPEGRPGNWLLWPDAKDPALRLLDLDVAALWETTDLGASWEYLGDREDWDPGWSGSVFVYGLPFSGDAKALGRDLSDPDAMLWADSQFLWASRDDGRSFSPLHTQEVAPGRWRSRGVDNIVPLDLAVDADGRHVYVALADLGCFRTEDGGASWQPCNHAAVTGSWEGYGGNAMTVLADPDRPGTVWMTLSEEIETPHTLLRSLDFAASWQPVGRGLPEEGVPAGLSLDPHSPSSSRTLFVTWGGDVYRSRDDGLSWERVLDCGGCRTTAVDPHTPGLVYAGGEAGLWRSTQGGAAGTWEAIGPEAVQGHLGGEFWDTYWEGVAAIRPDPDHPGWVYAAVFGEARGLYRSQDFGDTWEHLWAGPYVWDVAPVPGRPGHLLLATSSARYSGGYHAASRGLLYSPDGGRTWHDANRNLAWPFVTTLRIVATPTPALWLISPGAGVYTGPLPP